jgi:hypothetical protein
MKNLVYFTLGLLFAWILHASWGAWQGQPWFDKEWFTQEGNQQFVAMRLLFEVLLPAAGFHLATCRFSLSRYPLWAIMLGLAGYWLAYPLAWLLVEASGFLLDPGSEASTQEYVTYTRILNWLTESAGFIAGACCGLLLLARSRWSGRDRHHA